VITASHDETALRDIENGSGGTVFQVPIFVPTTGTVRCQIKVYDLAGNLVIAGRSDNATTTLNSPRGEYAKLDLYWNGFNAQGMRAAPGTYRIVVFISYHGVSASDKERAQNRKHQGIVGIAK